MNELELNEYESRLLNFKRKSHISMILSMLAFILSETITFFLYKSIGYSAESSPKVYGIMAIVFFFIFIFGFIIPFAGQQFIIANLEEIDLARQILKCNDFNKAIEIFNSCWSRWDNLKIKQEALEKGMLLASQIPEIALIYKLAPSGSEIEKRALERLIMISLKEEKK